MTNTPVPDVSALPGIISGIVILLIIIISCIGNGAVLLFAIRKRKKLKQLDYLTVNLAVSDLLVSLTGYPLASISGFLDKWAFGDTGCTWYGFCGFLFGLNSMTTLSVIALGRYWRLCRKRHGETFFTGQMPKVVVAVWGYCLFWSILPIIGWSRYAKEPFHTSCTLDWASRIPSDQAYLICVFIFCFTLPLLVLVLCYTAITKEMFRYRRRVLRVRTNHFTNFSVEVRLIKSSIAVTIAYVLAWTPYAIVSFMAFVRDASELTSMTYVAILCAKSSAIYNPIIYVVFNQKFKNDMKLLPCCCGCRCYNITINIDTDLHPVSAAKHHNAARVGPCGGLKTKPVASIQGTNNKLKLPFRGKFSKQTSTKVVHLNNPLEMIIDEKIVNTRAVPVEDIPGPSTGPGNFIVNTNAVRVEDIPRPSSRGNFSRACSFPHFHVPNNVPLQSSSDATEADTNV